MSVKSSLKEKLILETALRLMFQGNYESADISSVSKYAMIEPEHVEEQYSSDENLRISAVKYAATVWIEYVRTDLEKEECEDSQLQKLLWHYITGTESHPESLSIYIDIWKKIRDMKVGDRRFLSENLLEVYNYYTDFFKETLKKILYPEIENCAEIEHIAWIMVVISDGFHIQSFIQPQGLDFKKVVNTICEMLKAFKNGNGEKR